MVLKSVEQHKMTEKEPSRGMKGSIGLGRRYIQMSFFYECLNFPTTYSMHS